ncbi:MAG: homoserine dehydrogenase [Pseudomonadota bacterium]
MSKPLILGVAGLGTVGTGLIELLGTHGPRLKLLLGREITIGAVSARSKSKDRGVDLSGMAWFDDPVALAASDDIDCFVELIGGEEGPARLSVEAALKAGKPVVTANKALLAKHGVSLAELAEKSGVALNFEAAVAGGIPVIKALREALVPNGFRRVYGILNGTCNYILTTMQEKGSAFEDVLKDAQAKGYAEADPTFDIGGFDTAHKLSILTSLAFGTKVAFDQVDVEGIEAITKADIEAADDLGYRIKLLGVAMQTPSGIEARVHPTMVAKNSAIAEVSGVTNCVAIDSDFTGNVLLVGPGAGGHPTAAAVAGDIVDVVRGCVFPPFVTPVEQLTDHTRADPGEHRGAYYVRLSVYDKPGAMAVIAKHMGDRDVSLESIVQRRERAGTSSEATKPVADGEPASVIIITHETTEQSIRAALSAIEADDKLSEAPQLIRIEQL